MEHESGGSADIAVKHVTLDGSAKAAGAHVGRASGIVLMGVRRDGGVNAKLVGAPSDRGELDAGGSRTSGQHAVMCESVFTVNEVDDLERTPINIQPERQGNHPFGRLDDPVEQGDVAFGDTAGLELLREESLRLRGEGDDHEPRGVHVESMDHEGPGSMGKVGLDARDDAVLLVRPDSRDGQESIRLGEDDERRSGVDDVEVTHASKPKEIT